MTNILTQELDPDWNNEEGCVELTLLYEGILLGNGKAKHKQEIRKAFHVQLKHFWELNPSLQANDRLSKISNEYQRSGYNFVPLVRDKEKTACALEIILLRPEPNGSIIKSGDIDNRLKTLFDALRVPETKEELGGYNAPSDEEKPFFCLLSDDRLIAKFSVETNKLLKPTNVNDVIVIIKCKTLIHALTWGNSIFA